MEKCLPMSRKNPATGFHSQSALSSSPHSTAEVEEPFQLAADARYVALHIFTAQHGAFLGLTTGVADKPRAAAYQRDGRVAISENEPNRNGQQLPMCRLSAVGQIRSTRSAILFQYFRQILVGNLIHIPAPR